MIKCNKFKLQSFIGIILKKNRELRQIAKAFNRRAVERLETRNPAGKPKSEKSLTKKITLLAILEPRKREGERKREQSSLTFQRRDPSAIGGR